MLNDTLNRLAPQGKGIENLAGPEDSMNNDVLLSNHRNANSASSFGHVILIALFVFIFNKFFIAIALIVRVLTVIGDFAPTHYLVGRSWLDVVLTY
jgi:hypothetical protein